MRTLLACCSLIRKCAPTGSCVLEGCGTIRMQDLVDGWRMLGSGLEGTVMPYFWSFPASGSASCKVLSCKLCYFCCYTLSRMADCLPWTRTWINNSSLTFFSQAFCPATGEATVTPQRRKSTNEKAVSPIYILPGLPHFLPDDPITGLW